MIQSTAQEPDQRHSPSCRHTDTARPAWLPALRALSRRGARPRVDNNKSLGRRSVNMNNHGVGACSVSVMDALCSISTVHRGARCTELRLPGGVRLLLDYGAEPACLLHYWPLCPGDPTDQAPEPGCIERQGWWHLQSPSRLEVPQLPPGELSAITAVLVRFAPAPPPAAWGGRLGVRLPPWPLP
jgi:hypothetical protein